MSDASERLSSATPFRRTTYIDRRRLLQRGGLVGGAALLAAKGFAGQSVFAQDATPMAAATPVPESVLAAARSVSRDGFKALLREAFAFEDPASQGGVFIVGDRTDIGTTNAILGADDPTNPFLSLIFETLFTSSPIDGAPVPGLADAWELAADGVTWTFQLHPGVLWHDGTPFTADDVAFSYSIQANPDVGSSYTGTFNETVASWRVVDPLTFEVTANRVTAPIVFLYSSYCPIMPRHVWESVAPAQWRDDPGSTGQDPARVVGTGPFRFQEWVQGDRLTLARNDEYWDDVPVIDTLIHQVWPDLASAVEALRTGQIDTINDNIPPTDVESLAAEDALDVAIFDTFDFNFYAFNLDPAKTTLFEQREVRQALFYALDRQAIVENINLGYGQVARGTQSTLSIAYAPDRVQPDYAYDLDRARQLLADAGWADGDGDGIVERNGTPLAFELMYPAGAAVYDQVSAYMQETWGQIGVQMTPAPVDFATALVPAITETFDYEVAYLSFSWDPDGDQSAMFATDQYQQGFNFMRYSNPEVDRLFAESAVELDPERRVELLIEAQNLVWNDAPVGVISFIEDRRGYNVRARNFFPNDFGGLVWSTPYLWINAQ